MSKKIIASYVRESTREQAVNGYNLSDQKKKIISYLQIYENDYELISYEDGGYSAKSLNRPGLKALICDIKEHKINVLIIHNLDRLTRRIKDLIWLLEFLQQYDVKLISITEKLDTDSASGKFFTYLLCLIAQWEQDTISERTIRGMKESAEQGNYIKGGTPPFGYNRKDGKLVINRKEMNVVVDVFNMILDLYTLEEVSEALEDKYFIKMRSDRVSKIVRNTIYIGYYQFQGKKYVLDQKIISDEIFAEANLIVSKRSRRKKHCYSFQDLVFTKDNKKMVCVCSRARNKLFLYYTDKASKLTISEQNIKNVVLPELSKYLGQKDLQLFTAEKEKALKENLSKQRKLLRAKAYKSKVLKELVQEQHDLEKMISCKRISHRLLFLESLSPTELNKLCKAHIKRINICDFKEIVVIYKSN